MEQKNLAFLFPGQGSQKVGMMSELASQYSLVIDTFAEASEALGYDLWQKVQEGPAEAINLTEVTQPALLTSSIAAWRVWLSVTDVRPAFLAGHSLGEWSALVAAGVVEFSEAVRLVRLRGKFMQEAVPAGKGAMAAIIGLDDEQVEEACSTAAGDHGDKLVVSAVNYNSPGQLVIAGDKKAVDTAIEYCKAYGAKRALPLPVSAPFHTSLMQPAAKKLAKAMEETVFKAPLIPIIHNVTAAPESDPEKIKMLMVEQIYSAVRWVECVQGLGSRGVDLVTECGPGKVLIGLVKRIQKEMNSSSLETPAAVADAQSKFQ